MSMGGQIPNNIALPLHHAGVKVMGTSPLMIDRAEDREKFSRIIDDLGLQQAEWKELSSPMDAVRFADKVGYPVLVRPSFVLSGAGMYVSWSADQLAQFLQASVGDNHAKIVISKFITGGREIEMDGVAKNGVVKGCAIHEHIEVLKKKIDFANTLT